MLEMIPEAVSVCRRYLLRRFLDELFIPSASHCAWRLEASMSSWKSNDTVGFVEPKVFDVRLLNKFMRLKFPKSKVGRDRNSPNDKMCCRRKHASRQTLTKAARLLLLSSPKSLFLDAGFFNKAIVVRKSGKATNCYPRSVAFVPGYFNEATLDQKLIRQSLHTVKYVM